MLLKHRLVLSITWQVGMIEMAENKQTQKAGDNSQQIQASTVIINKGIDEAQVRKICSEVSHKAMEEYTAESYLTVEKRISDFANVLIPRIEKIENGFEAFADPEFQVELKKLKWFLPALTRKRIMRCSRNCFCTELRIGIIAG